MSSSTYFLIVVPALAALATIIIGILKSKGKKATAFLHAALVFISLFLIIIIVVSTVLLISNIASRSNSTEELSELSEQDETEPESNCSTLSSTENETNDFSLSLSVSEDMPASDSNDSTNNELPSNVHENTDDPLNESEYVLSSTSAEDPTNECAINAFNAWVENRATEDDMTEIVSYILAQIDISDRIEYGFVNEQFDDLNRFFYAESFESEFSTLDELVLRIEDVIVTNQTYNNGSVYNLSFELNNDYRLRLSMKYISS